jgi:hypothetical protein
MPVSTRQRPGMAGCLREDGAVDGEGLPLGGIRMKREEIYER